MSQKMIDQIKAVMATVNGFQDPADTHPVVVLKQDEVWEVKQSLYLGPETKIYHDGFNHPTCMVDQSDRIRTLAFDGSMVIGFNDEFVSFVVVRASVNVNDVITIMRNRRGVELGFLSGDYTDSEMDEDPRYQLTARQEHAMYSDMGSSSRDFSKPNAAYKAWLEQKEDQGWTDLVNIRTTR